MRILILSCLVACASAHPSPSADPQPEQADPVTRSESRLRTRPFKYEAYWKRLKAQIVAQWRPNFDPLNPKTIFVWLRIEILEDGSLGELWVEQSSGIPSEDAEAIRSVRAAAPFEPPPPALSSCPCLWHSRSARGRIG
jgi:TonB family protein